MLPAALAVAVPLGEIVADIGITTIVACGVNNIIKPQAVNAAHKLCIYAGEAAIAGLVCDKANNSIESGIEEIVDYWKTYKEYGSLTKMLAEEVKKNGGQE